MTYTSRPLPIIVRESRQELKVPYSQSRAERINTCMFVFSLLPPLFMLCLRDGVTHSEQIFPLQLIETISHWHDHRFFFQVI